VGLRPEHLRCAPADAGEGLAGELELVEHLGDACLAYVRLPGIEASVAVKLDAQSGARLQRHAPLRLQFEREHLIAFDAQGRSLWS
jgi:ABC-type sugar transport system ATPase subunit